MLLLDGFCSFLYVRDRLLVFGFGSICLFLRVAVTRKLLELTDLFSGRMLGFMFCFFWDSV